MTGIRGIGFINQTILTKSVYNGFKPITIPGINSFPCEFLNIDNRQ
jgi:hypothetical protein